MTTATIHAATAASHTALAKAEILDTTGAVLDEIALVGGEVTSDVDNAYRTRCDLTVMGEDGTLLDSYTTPGAYEVKVSKGIRSNGVDYYIVSAGTNYTTAIQTLISSRLAGVTFNFATTTTTTPLLVFRPQEDPWEKATEMAASIGMELFFDRDGVCVLRPVPDPTTAPIVASYVEGTSANLLDVTRQRSDEGAYSHILVVGASSGSTAPVLAHARDTDPTSPTYYLGPFGDVPLFITSGYITTLGQAQAQADAELLRRSGLVEQVALDVLVDPTLAVGDVIEVTSTSTRLNSRYAIESLVYPLTTFDPMTASMRKRKT